MVVSLQLGAQMVASMTSKDRRSCLVAAVLMLLALMTVSFNLDLVSYVQRIVYIDELRGEDVSLQTPNRKNVSNGLQQLYSRSHKVRELLDKLREASRLAADGRDYTLKATEREAWHMKYPCQSRSELPAMYVARKHVRDISRNPMWDEVWDEYSNLHRICMKRVGNVSEHFLRKSTVTVPGCKFLLADGKNGLGSKLLVTVSAMLYAIVSQRVLLMPSWLTFRSVLCEPFVGSSWILDTATFQMPGPGQFNNSWVEGKVFTQNLKQRLKLLQEENQDIREFNHSATKSKALPPLADAVVVTTVWPWLSWYPDKWFYCTTEQRYLSEVTWMYFSGCIYSIPDLFGSTPFGATLQALFPDKMVVTRMVRSALLPSDGVWRRFKHLNHVYFQQAHRRVAIQLHFFENTHETMSAEMNRRVLDCALANGILPTLNYSTTGQYSPIATSQVPAPITTVFIASLHSDLRQLMSEFYLRSQTTTGEAVGVVQITSRVEQWSVVEEDTEALVEMLLLSVSDSLLITPVSAFGGMGEAFGGLTPWLVRVTPGDGVSCERAQTVDPCMQDGYLGYDCPNDPPSPPEWTGLVGDCLTIDLGERIVSGIQILDDNLRLHDSQDL